MKHRRNYVVIEILSDAAEAEHQALDRVYSWLETFGYTATSHGFEFLSVGIVTGKQLPSSANNHGANDGG